DRWLAEARWLDSATEALRDGIAGLANDMDARLPSDPLTFTAGSGRPASDGLADFSGQLAAVRDGLRSAVETATTAAEAALLHLSDARRLSSWQEEVTQALDDSQAYLQELADLGLDPDAYGRVRTQLVDEEA